uniref:CUE domain-containing protein n=1 Tax=Triticum urartu TaxID=4572 RepID=A0A8R7TLP3_TRIUA
MAFKQVFCALREVFPQVDLRILKAVASQYSSDVDAAVGFVLSDVIPAVSEPTETVFTLQDVDYAEHDHTDSRKSNLHSGGISLVDLGAREDTSALFGTSAESSGTVGECDPFSDYDGPFQSKNKIEKCSQIEDKVVINETRIPTTVMNSLLQEHYALLGSSSTSAAEPHMMEYEQSDSGGCNDHCAAEKDEVTPETEIGNRKHCNDNYELSDLLASSGNMLPLFKESPSDCAVKHGGQVPLKLSDETNRHQRICQMLQLSIRSPTQRIIMTYKFCLKTKIMLEKSWVHSVLQKIPLSSTSQQMMATSTIYLAIYAQLTRQQKYH